MVKSMKYDHEKSMAILNKWIFIICVFFLLFDTIFTFIAKRFTHFFIMPMIQSSPNYEMPIFFRIILSSIPNYAYGIFYALLILILILNKMYIEKVKVKMLLYIIVVVISSIVSMLVSFMALFLPMISDKRLA